MKGFGVDVAAVVQETEPIAADSGGVVSLVHVREKIGAGLRSDAVFDMRADGSSREQDLFEEG